MRAPIFSWGGVSYVRNPGPGWEPQSPPSVSWIDRRYASVDWWGSVAGSIGGIRPFTGGGPFPTSIGGMRPLTGAGPFSGFNFVKDGGSILTTVGKVWQRPLGFDSGCQNRAPVFANSCQNRPPGFANCCQTRTQFFASRWERLAKRGDRF